MKIDLSAEADKHTFISWLVCALTAGPGMFEKCYGKYGTTESRERVHNAEVKLTINGVEFDAKPTLERLYEEFQREAARAGQRHAEAALTDAVTLKLEEIWPNYRERD